MEWLRRPIRATPVVGGLLALGATLACSSPARAEDVFVHLAVKRASLSRVAPDHSRTHVCTAPCDEWVPGDGQYVLEGDDVPHNRFELEPHHGYETVSVRETDDVKIGAGVAMLGAAFLSIAGGAVFLASSELDFGSQQHSNTALGVTMMAVGGALAVGGVLVIVWGREAIMQEPYKPAPDAGGTARTVPGLPTRRETLALEGSKGAPMMLPVLTLHF